MEAWFQRTTTRKWPTGNQMVTWPMTSREPARSNSDSEYTECCRVRWRRCYDGDVHDNVVIDDVLVKSSWSWRWHGRHIVDVGILKSVVRGDDTSSWQWRPRQSRRRRKCCHPRRRRRGGRHVVDVVVDWTVTLELSSWRLPTSRHRQRNDDVHDSLHQRSHRRRPCYN